MFDVFLLRQSFTLPLEQAVACLSTFKLTVHLTQSLSGWEDGLSLDVALAVVIS
jgi:hypothetical protein